MVSGPAKILQCQRQGVEKPEKEKRKEICKMWASEGRKQLTGHELPGSSNPVYEIWAPVPPAHGGRIPNGWKMRKPQAISWLLQCVLTFYQLGPDWTGINISFTLGPCSPALVPWSSEGLQSSRHLQNSSRWSLSPLKIAYFVLEYSMIPVAHLLQGRTTPSPKCFLLRNKREASVIRNKGWLLFLLHALLSIPFCPLWQEGQGGYLY